MNRLPCVGPLLVLLAWYVAGQWDQAGVETHAWLQCAGVVGLASLVPLPGTAWSFSDCADRLQWWGWIVVMSLVAAA